MRRRKPVLIVCMVPPPIAAGLRQMSDGFRASLETAGRRVVDTAARIAADAAPSVAVSAEVVVGRVGPAVLEFAESADTLVVDARGRGGTGTVLGSLSSLVARLATCPVAVVRPAREEQTDGLDGPVIVGVDGSENSYRAVDVAFEEASSVGARLVAAHSWSDVPVAVYSMSDV